jgi:hypothetical protein
MPTLEILAAWVLSLLTALAPQAPWTDTYGASARAIARVSLARPLFQGASGPAKTGALLAAVGLFESSLRPDAEGDCTKDGKGVKSVSGRCPPGATPHSWCFFQVNESNFATLGITRAQIQGSVEVCADAAIELAHVSFGICRARPLEDRLAQYAAGKGGCGGPNGEGLAESRHRVTKGRWLFERFPIPSP